jgi:bla regulator protein blaR1
MHVLKLDSVCLSQELELIVGALQASRLDLRMKLRRRLLLGTYGFAGIAALVIPGLTSTDLRAQAAADTPSAQPRGFPGRQTAAAPRISFDVVSVRQSKPGTPPGERLENGRFTANLTLFGYIEFAYNLMPAREEMDSMLARAPKWVSADNFEIQAVSEGNPTKDQTRLMVRSLLADRFRLQVHTVTAQTAVIALILDKPGATGPKLRPHSEGQPCDVHLASPTPAVGMFPPACEELLAIPRPQGALLVAARNTTMEQIATFISSLGLLTRPVVDQTGLDGRLDFTIEFTPERNGPPAPQDVQPDDFQITTLQEALHEQLGLKLKSTTAPLDTLVIDHAERPSEN